jgi:hypothetical protein
VNPFTLVVRRSSYTPSANAGAVHEDWRRLLREPNLEKLNALVGKLVGDLGISLGGASILPGDRLGLYKAMVDGGKTDIPL